MLVLTSCYVGVNQLLAYSELNCAILFLCIIYMQVIVVTRIIVNQPQLVEINGLE